MSDRTEPSSAARALRETVTETVDTDEVESMLEGAATARSVGRDLGSRVGRELGSTLGRELGAVVAVDLREREGPRAILGDVIGRLAELTAALLRNVDVESVVSRTRELGTSLLSDGPTEGSLVDVTSGDAGEDVEEDGTDATGVETSAEDLKDMREETYRELLEVMSYRDLQSVAKEVGVKANLSQEEIVEQIVAEFSGETDE